MAKLTSTAGAPFWLGVATLTKVLLFAGRTTGLVLVALVACWLSLAREASARVVSFFVSSKLVSSNRPAPRSSSSWEEVASPIKFSNLYCELCQGTSQPTKYALEWVQCSLRTKEGETEARWQIWETNIFSNLLNEKVERGQQGQSVTWVWTDNWAGLSASFASVFLPASNSFENYLYIFFFFSHLSNLLLQGVEGRWRVLIANCRRWIVCSWSCFVSFRAASHGGVCHGGVRYGGVRYGGVRHGGVCHGGVCHGGVCHRGANDRCVCRQLLLNLDWAVQLEREVV